MKSDDYIPYLYLSNYMHITNRYIEKYYWSHPIPGTIFSKYLDEDIDYILDLRIETQRRYTFR